MNTARDRERETIATLSTKAEPTTAAKLPTDCELSTEAALLLICARPRLTERTAEQVRRLAAEVTDWEMLIELSLRHRVMPLLFRRLNTLCSQTAPAHVHERLRELFHLNAARNHFMLDELLRLAELFEAEGIPAIAYKGPVLAQDAYGDIALRQFNDLDLMVKASDMQRVSSLLSHRGYAPQWQLTRAQEHAYLRGDCERLFALKEGQIFLDIHWALVRNYFALKLDYAGFRRRSKIILLGDTRLRSFVAEDLLIILCVHAAKDLWTRLLWICDIAALLDNSGDSDNRSKLNWQLVFDEAEASGASRMLLLGLSLAQRALGVVLPEEARRRILLDLAIEPLTREVLARLFQSTTRAQGSLAESLFHLRVHQGLSDKVRYIVRYLTTTNPADWNYIALPDRLFFLYYLVRPLRLLTRPR